MIFTDLFYKHIMFRKSCGKCHFCNTTRPSDITLADFWGWQKTAPDFNKDDKGCSLIFLNTEKGKQLFEEINNKLDIIPAEICKCMQANLQHPSVIHPNRNKFEKDYVEKGFNYVINNNYDSGLKYTIVSKYRDVFSPISSFWVRIKRFVKRHMN